MIMAGINEPILYSRLCAKFSILIFALNLLHSTSGLYGGHLLCFGHTVWAYQAHTGNSHHWADPGEGGRGLLLLQKLQRCGKPVFPPQAARIRHVTRTWPIQFPARIVRLGRKQGSYWLSPEQAGGPASEVPWWQLQQQSDPARKFC